MQVVAGCLAPYNQITMTLFIDGPKGRLEAELWLPEGDVAPRAVVAMAHPNPAAGGTMRTTALFRASRGLQAAGCAVLRFNFRGVGLSEGVIEAGPCEVEDLRAAVDELERRFPEVPRWAGGFSFGSRTAAALGNEPHGIERLVLIAMPVDAFDCSALKSVAVPGYVVQAGEDEYGNLMSLKRHFPELPDSLELDEIEGTDHFFRTKTRELEERVRDYALRHLKA